MGALATISIQGGLPDAKPRDASEAAPDPGPAVAKTLAPSGDNARIDVVDTSLHFERLVPVEAAARDAPADAIDARRF